MILFSRREQRLTGVVVFILTGLSVLMAPILKVIVLLVPNIFIPPERPFHEKVLGFEFCISPFRKH